MCIRDSANEVYKNGYTGKNVRIAVLDTGVFLHRDLRNRVFGFKDFVDGRGYCYDDNGHGTHVTGIICSNGTIKGIAPDAQVALSLIHILRVTKDVKLAVFIYENEDGSFKVSLRVNGKDVYKRQLVNIIVFRKKQLLKM